jgi:hypothetical protein
MDTFCKLVADTQRGNVLAVRSDAEFDNKARYEFLCYIGQSFLHPQVVAVIEAGNVADIGALRILTTLE